MSGTLIGVFFAVVGLIMVGVAVWSYLRTRRFVKTAEVSQGMVVALVEGSDSEGGIMYAPVVNFQTLRGQPIQYQSSVSSNPPGFKVGQMVQIRYNPYNPQEARIYTFFQTWFMSCFFLAMGMGFTFLGSILAVAFAVFPSS